MLTRAAILAATLLAVPTAVSPQDRASVAEADAIRDTLTRPPVEHGTSAGEVVAFPFWLATLPVRLVLDGTAELAGYVAVPERYEPVVDGYRYLDDRGMHPTLVTGMGTRSGLALAVDWSLPGPISAETVISIRRYQRYALEWSTSPRHRDGPSRAWIFDARAVFSRFTQEPFWGTGIGTPASARTDFLLDEWNAAVGARHRIGRATTLTLTSGVERRTVGPGWDSATPDLVDAAELAELSGVDAPVTFAALGVTLDLDEVDLAGGRPIGVQVGLSTTLRSGLGGTDVDFAVAEAELGSFLPVSSHQYVSAHGRVTTALGGDGSVPFTYLPSLGGSSLHSYEGGRFRDRATVFVRLGWHWELWRDLRDRARAEAFLFVDQGSTGRAISSLSDPRSSWGFGLAGRWLEQARASAYVGFGAEGARLSGAVSAEGF